VYPESFLGSLYASLKTRAQDTIGYLAESVRLRQESHIPYFASILASIERGVQPTPHTPLVVLPFRSRLALGETQSVPVSSSASLPATLTVSGTDLTPLRTELLNRIALSESMLREEIRQSSASTHTIQTILASPQTSFIQSIAPALPQLLGTLTHPVIEGDAVIRGGGLDIQGSFLHLASGTISVDSGSIITNTLTVRDGNLNVGSTPYIFPASQGGVGELLANDGSGNLYWSGSAASAQVGWIRTPGFVSLASSTDFVGIGTASPSSTLHVVGSSTVTGQARFLGTTWITGTNGLVLGGASNGSLLTRFQQISGDIAQNDLTFRTYRDYSFETDTGDGTAGTPRLTIKGVSGNVGIGAPTPIAKLDVRGGAIQFNYNGSSNGGNTYFDSYLNEARFIQYGNSGNPATFFQSGGDNFITGGNVGIGTTVPSSTFHVVGTSTFTGNVGIGTSTPGYALTILGSLNEGELIRATNHPTLNQAVGLGIDGSGTNYGAALFLNGTKRLVAESNGGVLIGSSYVYQDAVANGLTVEGRVGIGTSTPSGKLEITTAGGDHIKLSGASLDGGMWTSGNLQQLGSWNVAGNRMTIDLSSGSVGIGTTAPYSKLHIVTADNVGGEVNALTLSSPVFGNAVGDAKSIVWRKDIGTTDLAKIQAVTVPSGMELNFQTYGSGGLTEKVRINKEGNLGIGTSTPSSKLSVSVPSFGDPSFSVFDGAYSYNIGYGSRAQGSTYFSIYKNSGIAIFDNGSGGYEFQMDGSPKLTIQTVTGNVGIGTSAPSSTLHVVGTSTFTGTVQTNDFLTNTGTFSFLSPYCHNKFLFLAPFK
jgi:hypothetical protein